MIARIQLLRRSGVLLAGAALADAWSEEGYVETLDGARGTGRRLVLRALRSTPGHGVLFELFRPSLVSIEHGWLRVRGVEPVTTAEGIAAVIQEWLIQPRQ